MEETEDDDAHDSEDEHESALAEEPFADFALCSFEGVVKAVAFLSGEEGEEEAVGVFAFEHEVDAEEGGGEDVEEVREPEGQRGEEVAGGGVKGPNGALGDGVDSEPVGEGDFLDFGDDVRNSCRKIVREAAKVAQYRWKASGEEESNDEGDGDDEENNGYGAGRMIAAKVDLGDASDGGHEDDSEEGADVEDQKLFLYGPGEGEEEKDADREEDVAANCGAGSLLVRRDVFW